jgi:hypothetical protein
MELSSGGNVGRVPTGDHRSTVRHDAAFPCVRSTETRGVQHPLVVEFGSRTVLEGGELMIAGGLLVLAAEGVKRG